MNDNLFKSRIDNETIFYESLTTFEQLCSYGVDFCNDTYKYMPNIQTCPHEPNLWEHDKGNNIRAHLIELNKLGYLTYCSQPCDTNRYMQYQLNTMGFKSESNTPANTAGHQRAFVSGFMKKNIAEKFLEQLCSQDYIATKRTVVSIICEFDDIDYIHSLNDELDNKPVIEKYIFDKYNINNLAYLYCGTRIKYDSDNAWLKHINDKNNIVQIDIASKRFDDYSDMFWKNIIEILRKCQ